jgi:hypothetical protein
LTRRPCAPCLSIKRAQSFVEGPATVSPSIPHAAPRRCGDRVCPRVQQTGCGPERR